MACRHPSASRRRIRGAGTPAAVQRKSARSSAGATTGSKVSGASRVHWSPWQDHAAKLRQAADLPKQPTGVVANNGAKAKAKA